MHIYTHALIFRYIVVSINSEPLRVLTYSSFRAKLEEEKYFFENKKKKCIGNPQTKKDFSIQVCKQGEENEPCLEMKKGKNAMTKMNNQCYLLL